MFHCSIYIDRLVILYRKGPEVACGGQHSSAGAQLQPCSCTVPGVGGSNLLPPQPSPGSCSVQRHVQMQESKVVEFGVFGFRSPSWEHRWARQLLPVALELLVGTIETWAAAGAGARVGSTHLGAT